MLNTEAQLRIGVLAKGFGLVACWQHRNVRAVRRQGPFARRAVGRRRRQLKTGIERAVAEQTAHRRCQHAPIRVIRHPAAVGRLCHEEAKSTPWGILVEAGVKMGAQQVRGDPVLWWSVVWWVLFGVLLDHACELLWYRAAAHTDAPYFLT